MALKMNSIKCPDCGASLPIEEGRTQIFCSYCGGKVIVTDENEIKLTYKRIDEAEIKKAEAYKSVKLKQLDLAKTSIFGRILLTIVWIIFSAILLYISIEMMTSDHDGLTGILLLEVALLIIFGGGYLLFKIIPDKEYDRFIRNNGGIKFPKSFEPFDDHDYRTALKALENAGFTNIKCISLHDITFGIFKKPGKIDSISVNGETIVSGGRVYYPDALITITYHGK